MKLINNESYVDQSAIYIYMYDCIYELYDNKCINLHQCNKLSRNLGHEEFQTLKFRGLSEQTKQTIKFLKKANMEYMQQYINNTKYSDLRLVYSRPLTTLEILRQRANKGYDRDKVLGRGDYYKNKRFY